jgi:TolB protein
MIDRKQTTTTGQARQVIVRAAFAASLAGTLALSGCNFIEGGVPLSSTATDGQVSAPSDASRFAVDTPPAGPAPGDAEPASEPRGDSTANPSVKPSARTSVDVSPADLMFQSTSDIAPTPASAVNVFGELDGFGPSVFAMGGKAGYQQHTFVEEGFDAEPDVSPDGKWIVFASTRHSEYSDIYLQRTDGLAVTQLTTDPSDESFPRFSRDGKSIAFASNRSGNWDIYVMDIEGKNVQQVTRAPTQEIHPSFSPTGDRVVFSALGARSGQWEIWTVDVQNLERSMIGYGLFPEWSPRTDRDIIAFQRSRQRGTRWFSLWTLELIEDDAKNLTEVAYSTNAAIVAPTWSPDGKRLAFCTIVDPAAAKGLDSESTRGTSQDLWTVNADGTDRKRLTDAKGVNMSPSWSSDGRVFFVSDRAGTESIWSVPAQKARGDTTARAPRFPDESEPQTASVPTEPE